MKSCLMAILLLAAVGCRSTYPVRPLPPGQNESAAPSNIRYAGGDGSSMHDAVIISGAHGESDGIKSEYSWVQKMFPGSEVKRQALLNVNDHAYDRLDIETADGKSKSIYFDITDFFGKF